MRIGLNEFDHRILALLRQQRERPENSGLNGDTLLRLCQETHVSRCITVTAAKRLCSSHYCFLILRSSYLTGSYQRVNLRKCVKEKKN